jgi:mannose-1-phosphate guanylyltransferase
MAGGSGTRFWPRSRNATPKQILKITSDQFTMIQMAYNLVSGLVPDKNIHVVTNSLQAKTIKEQLSTLSINNILQEPCARDTAPCIGLAAAYIHQIDPEAIMLVMPSDHLIKPTEKFHQAVKAAAEIVAKEDTLVTFGITPQYPATAYGYIEKSNQKIMQNGLPIYQVKQFKEKPDEKTAKKFVESNQYYWNAGIFVWKAKYILELFKELMPELYNGLQKMRETNFKNIAEVYPQLPKISIDFAIMEKAKSVKVIGVDYSWDDIGSWESLVNHYPKDKQENLNTGNIVHLDSKNCIVINDDMDSLITTIGLENLLIVKSGNSILIADRNKGQDVKKLIEDLKNKKLHDYL